MSTQNSQAAAYDAIMASFGPAPEPVVDGMGTVVGEVDSAAPAAHPGGAIAAPDAPAEAPVTTGQLFDAADGRTPENGQPDPQTAAPDPNPAPATPQRRKLTASDFADADIEMVVNGKTVVVSGAEYLREQQRQESANRRYQEAARIRAEAEAMREAMSEALTDPARLRAELAAAGYNPAEIAKALYEQEQAEASLTPEQRRIRELEQETRRHQAAEAQRKQAFEAYQVEQARVVYETAFNDVLDTVGVPTDAPLRPVLMRMLADKTIEVESNENRRYTKREAREFIANVTRVYERPAPEITVEQRRAMLTAEDVAWFHAQQKAQKPQAAPQLARSRDDVLSQPRDQTGKFAGYQPRQQMAAGGRVVMNPGDAFRGKF